MSEQSPELIELMSLQVEYDRAVMNWGKLKEATKDAKKIVETKQRQLINFIRELNQPNLFRKPEGEIS